MPQVFWQHQPAQNARLAPGVYTTIGQPVFLAVRAIGKLKPFTHPVFADIFVECLLAQRLKSGCEVVAYCVMPDHFHAIVASAQTGASSLLYGDRLKGWSGYCLRKAGWKGPLWQPRSYDHAIRQDEDLRQIVEYTLHNPVRAGLVKMPEEYLWSGMPDPLFVNGELR
jgi:REP element-mobilizing transposase RayT